MKLSKNAALFLLVFICFKQSISDFIPSQSSSQKTSSSLPDFRSSSISSASSTHSSKDSQRFTYSGHPSPIAVPNSQFSNRSSCWDTLSSPEHCSPYNATQRWLNTCYCSDTSSRALYSEAPLFCCNFYGFAANWSHFTLRYGSLDLRNATELDVVLDARVLDWINLVEVSTARLTFEYGKSEGQSHLSAYSSSVGSVPHFRTVYLKKCEVREIRDNPFVGLLTIENSKVETLFNLNVGNQVNEDDFESYMSMKIFKSTVRYITAVAVYGYGAVQYSDVHAVDSSSIESLVFTKTNIDIVYPFGLSCKVGPCLMEYLNIRHMHRKAMVVRGTLRISNVVIEKCEEPCFLLDNFELYIHNFRVNNRMIFSVDNAIFNSTYVEYRRQVDEFSSANGVCRAVDKSVVCDEPYDTKLELILQMEPSFDSIKIFHHRDIVIYAGLYANTIIVNVTGDYYCPDTPTLPIFVQESSLMAYRFSSHLTLDNCSFDTVFAPCVYSIDVLFGHRSYVGYLDLGEMNHFSVSSLNIKHLENLTYKKYANYETFYFGNGTIEVIQSLAFLSPGAIEECTIGRVEHIKIDHPGGYLNSTRIENCVIGEVLPEGIAVDDGILVLKNVTFQKLTSGMIRLSPTAKLLLSEIRLENSWGGRWCKEHGPVVSAQTHSQVVMLGVPKPSWLFDCVKIRRSAPQFRPLLPRQKTIDPIKDCTSRGPQSLVCNMNGTMERWVLGNTDAFDRYRNVEVKNAKNFVLEEQCLHEITLDNVQCNDMAMSYESCYNVLMAYESLFLIIQGNFMTIDLHQSIVNGLFPIAEVHKFRAEFSLINLVHMNGLKIEFINTTIASIGSIHAKEHLHIINCHVSLVKKGGIFIPESGILVIQNSTLNIIGSGAIIVHGRFEVDGLRIEQGSHSAILLKKKSDFVARKLSISEHCSPKMIGILTKPNTWDEVFFKDKYVPFRDQIGFLPLSERQYEMKLERLRNSVYVFLVVVAGGIIITVSLCCCYRFCTREVTSSDALNQEHIQMDTLMNDEDYTVGEYRPGVHDKFGPATGAGDAEPISSLPPGKFPTISKSPGLSDCFEKLETTPAKVYFLRPVRRWFRNVRDRIRGVQTVEFTRKMRTDSMQLVDPVTRRLSSPQSTPRDYNGNAHNDRQRLLSDGSTLSNDYENLPPRLPAESISPGFQDARDRTGRQLSTYFRTYLVQPVRRFWQSFRDRIRGVLRVTISSRTSSFTSTEALPLRPTAGFSPEPLSQIYGPSPGDASRIAQAARNQEDNEEEPPPLPPRRPINPRIILQQDGQESPTTRYRRHTGGTVVTTVAKVFSNHVTNIPPTLPPSVHGPVESASGTTFGIASPVPPPLVRRVSGRNARLIWRALPSALSSVREGNENAPPDSYESEEEIFV